MNNGKAAVWAMLIFVGWFFGAAFEGRYKTVAIDRAAGVYFIDRFSGGVRFCQLSSCEAVTGLP